MFVDDLSFLAAEQEQQVIFATGEGVSPKGLFGGIKDDTVPVEACELVVGLKACTTHQGAHPPFEQKEGEWFDNIIVAT